MNLSDLKTSKFLKRDDVGRGALVTIRCLNQMNVAKEGADPEMKTVIHFDELDKPLVLNSTNGQIIAQITRCENDIERCWVGQKVVLYDDPNVSFGGKLVGGIRVRAPKLPPVQTAPAPRPDPVFTPPPVLPPVTGAVDDDLPF